MEYKQAFGNLYKTAKDKFNIQQAPKLLLRQDKENSNQLFGRTAHYNPEKKTKHLKSFAFYEGDNQVYSKELASSIEQRLKNLDGGNDIVEINLIDSNPANNPQPPKRVG